MILVDAVLLDMDGTLVDSDAAVLRAWQRWADEYEVSMQTLLPILHGRPADTTVRAVRPDLSADAVVAAARRQLEFQYDDLVDVRAAAGVTELLAALDRRRTPWAVVTSADARLAKARLGVAGIDAPVVVVAEDSARTKPHPDPYLVAAARLDVDPTRCLVVEDSQPGLDSGRAAGAKVAALRGLSGDYAIAGLAELAALLY